MPVMYRVAKRERAQKWECGGKKGRFQKGTGYKINGVEYVMVLAAETIPDEYARPAETRIEYGLGGGEAEMSTEGSTPEF